MGVNLPSAFEPATIPPIHRVVGRLTGDHARAEMQIETVDSTGHVQIVGDRLSSDSVQTRAVLRSLAQSAQSNTSVEWACFAFGSLGATPWLATGGPRGAQPTGYSGMSILRLGGVQRESFRDVSRQR